MESPLSAFFRMHWDHEPARIFHTLSAGSGDPAYKGWPGGVVGRVPSRGGLALSAYLSHRGTDRCSRAGYAPHTLKTYSGQETLVKRDRFLQTGSQRESTTKRAACFVLS